MLRQYQFPQARLQHVRVDPGRRDVGLTQYRLDRSQIGGAIIKISTLAAFEPDPLFPISGCSMSMPTGMTPCLSHLWNGLGRKLHVLVQQLS